MMHEVLMVTAALWAGLALYWLRRGIQRLWATSIVCGFGCAGWVLAAARELRWIGWGNRGWVYLLALCVGLVGVFAVMHHETQKDRPFS